MAQTPDTSFSISDYTNIPSTGRIADDMLPADQISFAYTFTYQKDADSDAALQSSLSGQVILKLKDAAGNLKATFDLRETFRITLFTMAPGLLFYVWNWDANKEQFLGTDASGAPLSTEGQFSLGVIPGGDSGTSDLTAFVSATFYSFIFNVEVNEGDTLSIARHTLSAGSVVARASLRVATRRVSAAPALVDGRCGQQFRVSSTTPPPTPPSDQPETLAQGTVLVRSRRLDSPLSVEQTEWRQNGEGIVFDKALGGAQIAQTQGNTLYVLGTSQKQLLLFRSQDEGKRWKQIMSEATNIKILAAYLARGGRYIVYGVDEKQKPTYLILKQGQDRWTVSESGPCTLVESPPASPSPSEESTSASPSGSVFPTTSLPTSRVNRMEEGKGGMLRLLATNKSGTLLVYLSRDGKEWRPSPVLSSTSSTSR